MSMSTENFSSSLASGDLADEAVATVRRWLEDSSDAKSDPSAERLAKAKRVKVKRAKPGVGIPEAKREEMKARKAAAEAVPLTYEQCYNSGWRSNYGDPSVRMQNRKGFDHRAFDDGYLDAAAGREKWHLRWCREHHNNDGGCGVA